VTGETLSAAEFSQLNTNFNLSVDDLTAIYLALASAGVGLTLGETSVTAYRGDRGKIAYDHSLVAHQAIINGAGFVKTSGTSLSYDNSVYLTAITKNMIETQLTGEITSHTHPASGGTMVYPTVGLALSTGTTWGTSVVNNSANWNTAFGWGNHSGLYSLVAHTHSGYQATLSGTGLVRSTAGTISYDTAVYLTSITKEQVEAVLTGDITSHTHTAYVPYTGATTNVDLGVYAQKASKFQLKTDATNILAVGEVGWNAHDKTAEIKLTTDVTLQLGQEQVRVVKNNTASTLLNGRLVRIVGYDNIHEYYLVEYSDNATNATAFVDFMLTEDIAANNVGIGTKTGIVHGLNTTGGTIAMPAYLGTAGQIDTLPPAYPWKEVLVGFFGKIDAVNGDILVDLSRAKQSNIDALTTALDLKSMQNPGVCQKLPIQPYDIVIDTTALTLTIATINNGTPITASNPVRFFTDGLGIINKWEKTSPVVFPTFTNTTGMWYFYFDSSGVAVTTQSVWGGFSEIAPVYRFYWNATLSGAARLVFEVFEAHLNDISATDHAWKHANGSIYLHGLDLTSNFLTTGTPNANGRNTVVSISSGRCSDDGLEWQVNNTTSPANYFDQDMGNTTAATLTAVNSGLFKIRTNDAGGLLSYFPATRFPFLWNSVNNRPQYITTLGVVTDVPDDSWFVYYVYNLADRGLGNAVKLVSAETTFTSLASAQAHSWETIRSTYSTLLDNEIRPLYKLIFYVSHTGGGSYDVGCKYSVLRGVYDIRKQIIAAATASTGSVFASNVIVAPTGGITTSNAQAALAELDTLKQNIVTLGADTVEALKTKVLTSTPIISNLVGSTTLDFAASQIFTITLTGDATLANPINPVVNAYYLIEVNQDVNGLHNLAWGTNFKFANGTAPVLSLDPNAFDMFSVYVKSATQLLVTYAQNFQ